MAKAPLALVKDKFGSKEALVAKVAALVQPLEGETKEDLKVRLSGASNKKLLKLLTTEEKVTELFGGKVDADYRSTLGKKSKGELLMLHTAAKKKADQASRKAKR
jgi:hypothetical protein